VLQAAASTWIREENRPALDWADRVAVLVESTLRDILATYRLDWLIKAPQSDQQHPRDEIQQRLKIQLKEQLHKVGAKLLNVDLGQIRVGMQDADEPEGEGISGRLSDIISDQWIDAWHANWKAQALTSRAEGEAELLRMDTARIEAQAEMIIGLAEILQPMVANQSTSEPYVLALRLVEALRWMSYDPYTRDYMPPEAMRTLKRLQQMLDSEAALPGIEDATETGGDTA
jgi:regulator of protease activity HflC (stomatin/prohibitin superfamily)